MKKNAKTPAQKLDFALFLLFAWPYFILRTIPSAIHHAYILHKQHREKRMIMKKVKEVGTEAACAYFNEHPEFGFRAKCLTLHRSTTNRPEDTDVHFTPMPEEDDTDGSFDEPIVDHSKLFNPF